MAHADVFQKLEKTPKNTANSASAFVRTEENAMDHKMLETIKLLGKQILEIREIIDSQNQSIELMKSEIVSLRKKLSETSGNIDLAMIDQKDLAKQFRILKATVTGEQIASQGRAYPNPEDIAKRFYKNYENSNNLFNSTINNGSNTATKEQEFSASWGALTPSQARANTPLEKSMQAENVAKEFIFGRIPKLLNLE
jgi:hypothetical protein